MAREWFLAQGMDEAAIARHFVGATTNLKAAAAFGIHTTFGFWDWVGGRYSLWSAIGLPIALAVGSEHFRALLAGAHAMDRHFADTPLADNLPVQLGLQVCAIARLGDLLGYLQSTADFSRHFDAVSAYRRRYGTA